MEGNISPIRIANKNDVALILSFIKLKAEFDNSIRGIERSIEATEERLLNTLFCENPFSEVVLYDNNHKVEGFALYHYRYSSFKARPYLWLDDLFVKYESRCLGIGRQLMIYLAQQSRERNCFCISWTANENNKRGVNFYNKLNANHGDSSNSLLTFTLDEKNCHKLAVENL
jgi:GNAT superfamily N-acetyltransferase